MYHIAVPGGVEHAILELSNFTVHGLGLADRQQHRAEPDRDGNRDRQELKQWSTRFERRPACLDVREVRCHPRKLHANQSPVHLLLTLFHLFATFWRADAT
jgi:hypothetical protein